VRRGRLSLLHSTERRCLPPKAATSIGHARSIGESANAVFLNLPWNKLQVTPCRSSTKTLSSFCQQSQPPTNTPCRWGSSDERRVSGTGAEIGPASFFVVRKIATESLRAEILFLASALSAVEAADTHDNWLACGTSAKPCSFGPWPMSSNRGLLPAVRSKSRNDRGIFRR